MAEPSTFVTLASAIDQARPECLLEELSKLDLWKVLAPEHDSSCQFPIVAGDTPLIYAARCGSLEAVKSIAECYFDMAESYLKHKVDMDQDLKVMSEGAKQSSPENYAIFRGCTYFDLLDWRNSRDSSALTVACSRGHLDIVNYLIHNGADLFQCSCLSPVVCMEAKTVCWHGFKALTQAAKKGHLDIVKCLIEAVHDINAKDRHGKKAIVYYTCFTCVEILEAVLMRGAEIDDVTTCGWTPLMVATVIHKHQMVECLLRFGANPNYLDERGNNALQLSLQWSSEPLDDMRHLLKYGADANMTNFARYTPLMWAQTGEHVDELVNYGAKIGVDLHFAIILGRVSAVKAMVGRGAVPMLRNIRQLPDVVSNLVPSQFTILSPLHTALLCGCVSIAEYFISIWFLTECDLVKLFWDENLLSLTDTILSDDTRLWAINHRAKPPPLAVQCFVIISSLLGDNPGRAARTDHLNLPRVLRQKLMCFDEDLQTCSCLEKIC